MSFQNVTDLPIKAGALEQDHGLAVADAIFDGPTGDRPALCDPRSIAALYAEKQAFGELPNSDRLESWVADPMQKRRYVARARDCQRKTETQQSKLPIARIKEGERKKGKRFDEEAVAGTCATRITIDNQIGRA